MATLIVDMTAPIPRACVMGHPVAHSRSPLIHGYWLKTLGIAGTYDSQDLTPEAFPQFFTNLAAHGYVGGNITVPHKEAAFRLVDRREPAAEAIGAVNTVWFEDGKLVGANSDVYGFIRNLDEGAPGWQIDNGLAVVLGAGGTARAAAYAFVERGQRVALVNRTRARAQEVAAHFGANVSAHGLDELARLLAEADVLANCTSLGMVGQPPLAIDLAPLKASAVVYDVVYVPLETDLLLGAKKRSHRTVDGVGMLLHQAGYGFQKWFGIAPTVTVELRRLIEDDVRAKTQSS